MLFVFFAYCQKTLLLFLLSKGLRCRSSSQALFSRVFFKNTLFKNRRRRCSGSSQGPFFPGAGALSPHRTSNFCVHRRDLLCVHRRDLFCDTDFFFLCTRKGFRFCAQKRFPKVGQKWFPWLTGRGPNARSWAPRSCECVLGTPVAAFESYLDCI